MLTVDLAGGSAPITVRQHSVAPAAVDAKVSIHVSGVAVVFPRTRCRDVRPTHRSPRLLRRQRRRADREPLPDLRRAGSTGRRPGGRPRHRPRLVLIETHNDIDTVVSYLGALAGRHVALPLPADSDHTSVVDVYDPDVIVRDGVIDIRHRPTHDLHPDLALLLSTSGSTGSPKLVRLSRTNLTANAEAIATYLDISANRSRRDDVADVVLLRTVRRAQPPAARRGAHSHRTLGGRRRVLGSVATPRGNDIRGGAAHVRAAGPYRLRARCRCLICGT